MAREDFNDLLWFLAVAEERSFTRAAAKLGIAQSTLSHTIKRLETRMGIRLLMRTTRNVAPTEAGERLRRSLAPRIAEIEAEIAALTEFRDKPAGTIRITLSDHAFESVVWPKLRPMLGDYPDIKLELSIDNGFRNIVEEGFDAGIRLGESVEKDMIAVRIGPDWRLVAVAPRVPRNTSRAAPAELVGHNCINHRQIRAAGFTPGSSKRTGRSYACASTGSSPSTPHPYGRCGSQRIRHRLRPRRRRGARDFVRDTRPGAGGLVPEVPGYFVYHPSRRQNFPAFRVIVDALRHGGTA